ncbi:unnamed protein product [Scytosiphon promiscuus]
MAHPVALENILLPPSEQQQRHESSKNIKAQVPAELEHPSSPLPNFHGALVAPWSPASTATSTPPFDFERQPVSPPSYAADVLPRRPQSEALQITADHGASRAAEATPVYQEGTVSNTINPQQERPDRLQGRFLRLLGRRKRLIPALKVGPPQPRSDDPLPAVATFRLEEAGRGEGRLCDETEGQHRRKALLPFVDYEASPTTVAASKRDPLHFDFGGRDSEGHGGFPEAAATAPASGLTTTAKKAVATKSPRPTSAALATIAEKHDTLAREALDKGLVLPCAPTDEEKALYYKSGRATLLSTGFISFCTLFVGMCIFTLSSTHFYWYGAPTVFVFVYMCCHYFGVSVWGKDFNPDAHADVVRKGDVEKFAPTIDVFLPVCNEPLALLANTWNHVLTLDYPYLAVHVLDDGAKDEVKALAEEYGFRYIRRDDRPKLKKAGNLRYAFARTSGELIAIFDADFCPRVDFLRETVPYLVDPSVGILQTPQYFRRRDQQTWVEQGGGTSQEAFYRLIQMNLDRFNAAVCVGSCGVYRRKAVEPFGGVAPIEHSEDMYTGYKMTELGYKIKYLPLCLAMGICPDEPRSYFMQQYRWCMGTATLVLQREFWQSDISSIHKLCFFNGMLFYLATALFVFLGPTPIMMLILIKADEVRWFYFGFTVPAIVFALIVIPSWSRQDSIFRSMPSQRVNVLQSYAHLFAIKDRLTGTVATWVPSGGKASKASSKAYDSSVRVLVTWNVLSTVLIVGGSLWRITEYPWYDFIIPLSLALCSSGLSLSTLWCRRGCD